MSIFGNILNKIFHHGSAPAPSPAPVPDRHGSPAPSPAAASAPNVAPTPQSPVDVGAVLEAMAGMQSDLGGNYKTSIVDLLKLLGLDSSLSARKELAGELGVHVGEDGSADQNIALQKAVMEKLAENGGIVPDSLRG